jgi:ABC-type nitrate/sulfonate/bicarbonate transport system permease component
MAWWRWPSASVRGVTDAARDGIAAWLAPAGFAVGLIAVWKLAVVVWAVPPFILPPPEAAWQALVANFHRIMLTLLFTLRNALSGLAVAFALAIALAAIFARSAAVMRAALPIVIGLRTAPVLAIAPVMIMVLGRGIGTSIAVVVIVSFFPIMVNAMRGFSATGPTALELMHVLGAGWLTGFVKVRLPFALPFIFTGLRSAATGTLLAAMLAEWLSGAPGLGTVILDAASYRQTGLLWAAVAVSTAVERRLTAWKQA